MIQTAAPDLSSHGILEHQQWSESVDNPRDKGIFLWGVFPPFGSQWHGAGEVLQRKKERTEQERKKLVVDCKNTGKYIFFWLFHPKESITISMQDNPK